MYFAGRPSLYRQPGKNPGYTTVSHYSYPIVITLIGLDH